MRIYMVHIRIELVRGIERIILVFPGYGHRRVTEHLKRESKRVNHKCMLRLMKENGLIKKPGPRYVKTTNGNHSYKVYPNLIKDLSSTRPNQVWVSDITYINVLSDFVYLTAILDKYSRKAVGYASSGHIGYHLTLEASQIALSLKKSPAGYIYHSDRGIQYPRADYLARLKEHGLSISISHQGNQFDNIENESFFKTLKYQEVYLTEYRTIEETHNEH